MSAQIISIELHKKDNVTSNNIPEWLSIPFCNSEKYITTSIHKQLNNISVPISNTSSTKFVINLEECYELIIVLNDYISNHTRHLSIILKNVDDIYQDIYVNISFNNKIERLNLKDLYTIIKLNGEIDYLNSPVYSAYDNAYIKVYEPWQNTDCCMHFSFRNKINGEI